MTPNEPGPARLFHLPPSIAQFVGVLPLRYFILRVSTAAGALLSGIVQTFVFARIFSPEDFSIYILIGTLGVSLWLFDLGAAKILFVRQRERYLADEPAGTFAAQSSAVLLLYALVVLVATLACFAGMALRPAVTVWQALEYALFFSFSALNLVWFPLRNISNAVDEFIRFEVLEALRRIGHIGMMLALLIGFPFDVFLVLANLFWFLLLALCVARLVRKAALSARLVALRQTLADFWHENRPEILRSANYAVGELVVYNYPYLLVPVVYGLGAPTIILDTVFKVFRGATLIFAAGLDPLVPRQTRAYAAGDAATLKQATWVAAVLCTAPTVVLCGLLLFAGDMLFALLLGKAATVPPTATMVLIWLLIANLAQNVASNLLLHTGFFHAIARAATFLMVAMALMSAFVLTAGIGMIGFLAGYAAVYSLGAALYTVYAWRGPFRLAPPPRA